MADPRKFYLTTPIYYVNARPHIGHAYTTIVADVLARRHRMLGDDTWFLTGTDEHGQKIERSAIAAGIPPQQFADQVSASFRSLWVRMGLTYDQYIRTTDAPHKAGVQKLFLELQARGFIYLSSYTGQYCVSEELFVEGPPGTIGPDGRPTETVTEENYFFKLSAFQRPLLDLVESDTLLIHPEARKNEVLGFLRGNISSVLDEYRQMNGENVETPLSSTGAIEGCLASGRLERSAHKHPYVPGALKDLSISRSSFSWGIPVPNDPKHVIYVWLDALANYMTAVGFGSDDPTDQAKFNKYWPADLHIIGKEIVRFHCVYWPAFLLALNPALTHNPADPAPELSLAEHVAWAKNWLPKQIVAHGWLLFEESKMSKSRGNIVRTETILDAFGTLCPASATGEEPSKKDRDLFAADVLRYFLLREIPFGEDGSFSFDAIVERYNSNLAKGYGNLTRRTLIAIRGQSTVFIESGSVTCYPTPWSDDQEREYQEEELLSSKIRAEGSLPHRDKNSPKFIRDETKFVINQIDGLLAEENFHLVLHACAKLATHVDGFLTRLQPWKLWLSEIPSDKRRAGEVLYTAAESIRIITALLYPILPYATARVWAQLGLGDIEQAARNGQLKNLKWGGLQPGTELGPLSPIFPRADKGLAQIMADIEASDTPGTTPFTNAVTPSTPATPTAHSTAPDAGPRTSVMHEPNPIAQVAGAAAALPDLPKTPPHTEAPASGAFATDAAASNIPDTPTIAIDDFVKIDLRVARILVAERIPKADKLLRLEVDLGYEQRQILSGIAEWYTPEELIGKKIVIIANLAPRKMRGLESKGMLLAASNGEGTKPILATFPDTEDLALGSRLR